MSSMRVFFKPKGGCLAFTKSGGLVFQPSGRQIYSVSLQASQIVSKL